MKKLISFLLIISFFMFACTLKKGAELNKMSEDEFQDYITSGIKRYKTQKLNIIDYLDSLSSLQALDRQHKAQVSLYRAIFLYKQDKLDDAIIAYKATIKQNKGQVNATLVSAYYLLGDILKKKNQLYQSLYYYNKAGELLKKYDIYKMPVFTAGSMLMRIALTNKYLNQVNLANAFVDAAIDKYQKYSTDKELGANIYTVKCLMFAAVENLNKDSLDFYKNKAIQVLGDEMSQVGIDNFNYFTAEYYYNAKQIDSALLYIQKVSERLKSKQISDELNLLSIYSRKKQYKKADEQLKAIQTYIDNKGRFDDSDSLLLLNNLIDYHLSRGDYKRSQDAVDNFLHFQAKFNNKEIQKNINELASVIDLQQKEEELANVKRAYEVSLQKRNLIIIVSVLLLLTMLAFLGYMKSQSDKRKLALENRANMVKIKLLQNQIKPHFIFNTLASIQSLIRQNKNDMSIRYLKSFSILLRQVLDLSRNAQISLEKELEMLNAYVEMQKLRKSNFELQITLSPDVEAAKHDIHLPALVLQPFVENTIVHGFKDIDYKGEIRIHIEDEHDYLFVRISDNGCGLKPQENKQKKSHGIDIIREHLLMLSKSSGKQANLTIKNHTNTHGVLVELKIPITIA